MNKKTFYIHFLGCKVNSYEVEAIAFDLQKRGYIEVKEDDNPDVVIINTCAVTETSSNKSKKTIKHFKNKYPNCVLCVMGCYSQYSYKFLSEDLGVDIVIGTSNRDKIGEYIDSFLVNRNKIVTHDNFLDIKKYENITLNRYFDQTRAYVKIQDGCDNYCTYCLIPYVRGRSRSREKDEILSEISALIKNNYKEIILTGIDQGSYGEDFTPKSSFSDLLEAILVNNKDLYRIRISSIETSQIDDKFLKLLSKYSNIANHLHIPLQSGSKHVLKLMNRKYDLDYFKEVIRKIREIRPDISITTDVIIGFPQESEEDFVETYNFIKEINFSKVHVFPYSDRNGTVASKMDGKIPQEVKKERVKRLISLSNKLELDYEKKFYNKEIEFLVESYDEKLKGYKAHSSNYLECLIKSEDNLNDKIVKIKFNKENSVKILTMSKK